ncbi:hypothetical protein J3458_021863 [Metarhizium acridum]|uniref:uncharacterized protein n=1 Tax=Metarhizium acridum TaxID=92637 RepID=UPI001C6CE385|nr:hypothetical protein J3458_021863 [Metarhizium acridum]
MASIRQVRKTDYASNFQAPSKKSCNVEDFASQFLWRAVGSGPGPSFFQRHAEFVSWAAWVLTYLGRLILTTGSVVCVLLCSVLSCNYGVPICTTATHAIHYSWFDVSFNGLSRNACSSSHGHVTGLSFSKQRLE